MHSSQAKDLARELLSEKIDPPSTLDLALKKREDETPGYLKIQKPTKLESTCNIVSEIEELCHGFLELIIHGSQGRAEYEFGGNFDHNLKAY